MGCHFLLQCMQVKSESEVAQSCPTPKRPHGLQPTRLLGPCDLPGKSIGVGCHCLLPQPLSKPQNPKPTFQCLLGCSLSMLTEHPCSGYHHLSLGPPTTGTPLPWSPHQSVICGNHLNRVLCSACSHRPGGQAWPQAERWQGEDDTLPC